MSTSARDTLDQFLSSPKTAPVILQGLGASIRLLVSSDDTAGAWCLLDYQAPPGFSGPHFHYHAKTTEVFYVIEGKLDVHFDQLERSLEVGELVRVAPGMMHRWGNPHTQPVHFGVLFSPGGGMENYFSELQQIVQSAPTYPLPDMTPVIKLGERFDTFPGKPIPTEAVR
jgi:mannose-6-phosphate isomerase-like protein (cupin superfamily)